MKLSICPVLTNDHIDLPCPTFDRFTFRTLDSYVPVCASFWFFRLKAYLHRPLWLTIHWEELSGFVFFLSHYVIIRDWVDL